MQEADPIRRVIRTHRWRVLGLRATRGPVTRGTENANGPRRARLHGANRSAYLRAASFAAAAFFRSSSLMFAGVSAYFANSIVNSALPWVELRSGVE